MKIANSSDSPKASLRALSPSPTLEINERCKALIQQGKRVFRFGFGQSPFPVPDSVVKGLQQHAHVKDYLPVQGLPQLRAAVAGFHHRKLGSDCSFDQVLIGPGSKELIFILQLAYSSKLLLPSPSWVSYAPQAKLLNKDVIWIESSLKHNWLIQPDVLDYTCQIHADSQKLLILNYPNNPVGNSLDTNQLKALAAIARKHQLLILSDEIYSELDHNGEHISISNFYPEGTIVSGGLSKWCGAGGWRLGTMVFPKELKQLQELVTSIASETFSAVSAPIQYAAVTAFEHSPEIDNFMENTRKVLKIVSAHVYNSLIEFNIEMPPATGGFYLFPSFDNYRQALNNKGIKTSIGLCNALLEKTGVALLPGSAFGRPESELTARLSFVDFDGKKILKAAAQNQSKLSNHNFLTQYAPNILEGTKQICRWLSEFN